MGVASMPEAAYSNVCAICQYKPRDLELYYRKKRWSGKGKARKLVAYSCCEPCRDAGKVVPDDGEA